MFCLLLHGRRTICFLVYAQRVIKMTWYGDMCFKQQAVTEFLLEEKDSLTNIHIQLKNVLCGVNGVDTGTVIHWAS